MNRGWCLNEIYINHSLFAAVSKKEFKIRDRGMGNVQEKNSRSSTCEIESQ